MNRPDWRYVVSLACAVAGVMLYPLGLWVLHEFQVDMGPLLFLVPVLFVAGMVLAVHGLFRRAGPRALGWIAAVANGVALLLAIAWAYFILVVLRSGLRS